MYPIHHKCLQNQIYMNKTNGDYIIKTSQIFLLNDYNLNFKRNESQKYFISSQFTSILMRLKYENIFECLKFPSC